MRSFHHKSFITATLYLAGALFLSLSLWSFDPKDPSFNSIGQRPHAENLCGVVGSFISDLLLQLLGATSWLLVGLLFYMAWTTFRRKSFSFSWVSLALGVVYSLNVAALLSHHGSDTQIYEKQILLGGVLGQMIEGFLVHLLNAGGGFLILWASFVCITAALFGQPLWMLSRRWKWAAPRMEFSFSEFFFGLFGSIFKSFRTMIIKSREKAPSVRSHETAPAQNMNFTASASSAAEEGEDEESAEDSTAGGFSFFKSKQSSPTRRKVSLKKRVQRRIANWRLPEISMLEDPPDTRYRVDEKEIKQKSFLLTDKLGQFSVKGEVKDAKPGPAVTLFEFKPNVDVKISKITELADDLSLALSSESVRIIAPIPGRDVVGIETSNTKRETVYLKDILALDGFWSDETKLPLALGRKADGSPEVVDLRKLPHLMVAGTTGSGKSVFVVCALTGLLFRHSPQTLRLILIDPKQVDLAAFAEVPHLLMPAIFEPKKAVLALNWAVKEMEKRYRSMSKFGARGLEAFNEKVEGLTKEEIEEHEAFNEEAKLTESYYFTKQPYIVIVVEEFGDLMAVDKGNVESAVVRLAQMARACGIHLILAMQSPRKDVVTGLIKTNIPGRISFKVASKMDSRIILDEAGAERLLARGDMLFLAPSVSKPTRHHGPWAAEDEIQAIMEYWSDQGEPEYDQRAMQAISKMGGSSMGGAEWADGGEEEEYDERYDEILAWASSLKTVSASLIQRKFRLGYPRAARLIESFEREGVVGPANGSKPRDILVKNYEA